MTITKDDLNEILIEKLRKIHGNKLLKYSDNELIKSYDNYFNSCWFAGVDHPNFLLFIW